MIKYKSIVEAHLSSRFKSFMNRDLTAYRKPVRGELIYDITRVYIEYNTANIYYDKYSGLQSLNDHIAYAQEVNSCALMGMDKRIGNDSRVDCISHDAVLYLPCIDFSEVEDVFRVINEFVEGPNYEIIIRYWSKFDVIHDSSLDIAVINIVINTYQLPCETEQVILYDHVDVCVNKEEE